MLHNGKIMEEMSVKRPYREKALKYLHAVSNVNLLKRNLFFKDVFSGVTFTFTHSM